MLELNKKIKIKELKTSVNLDDSFSTTQTFACKHCSFEDYHTIHLVKINGYSLCGVECSRCTKIAWLKKNDDRR